MPIKVAIVEDDDWIRDNLATQLGESDGFLCAGAFRTAEEAIARHGEDVVRVPGEAARQVGGFELVALRAGDPDSSTRST